MQRIIGLFGDVETNFETLVDLAIGLVTTGEQIFEQKLVFGNPLDWFDQISSDRVLQFMLSLERLENISPMLNQQLGGMGFVRAVFDVDVELLSLRVKKNTI